MSSIKDKACWYRVGSHTKWQPATFLEFGLEPHCDDGGSYTVAIVRFVAITPDNNVSFASDPQEAGK